MHYAEDNKDGDSGDDLFTPEFKRLKARDPAPDLSNVLDLSSPSVSEIICPYSAIESGLTPVQGLKPIREWRVYQFPRFPGFYVIQNPFLEGYQQYWVSRCLKDFPADKDNVTNLSALGQKRGQDLWDDFVKKQSTKLSKGDPLRQLRWTTLGYHYNWTSKDYSDDNRGDFPPDVHCLSQYLAASVGLGPYQAEAAIVNYYHLDSTLAGHTDHSEMDLSAALFSISFGQEAIFLLGGTTKASKPMALYVRSGDVCVMSGDSRLAYHAVPKILAAAPTTVRPQGNSDQSGMCRKLNQNGNKRAVADEDPLKEKSPPAKRQADSIGSSAVFSYNSCERLTLTPAGRSVQQGSGEQETSCDYTEVQANNCSDRGYRDYWSNIEQVNDGIASVLSNLDFKYFSVYLKTSRINLNVRQVLPPGTTSLKDCVRHNKIQ